MDWRGRLLARPMGPGDLECECVREWTSPPPPLFVEAVERWAPDTGEPAFDRACRLGSAIANAGSGPRLSTTSVRALAGLLAGDRGVCSDKAQVFTGICLSAGLLVREWGMSTASERIGHSLCEVWSPEEGRWLLIDPGRGLWASRADSGAPIGVSELADLVANARTGSVRLVPFGESFCESDGALPTAALYLNPNRVFCLLGRYQPFKADRFLRLSPPLPLAVAHGLSLLGGAHPRYLVYDPARRGRRLTTGRQDRPSPSPSTSRRWGWRPVRFSQQVASSSITVCRSDPVTVEPAFSSSSFNAVIGVGGASWICS